MNRELLVKMASALMDADIELDVLGVPWDNGTRKRIEDALAEYAREQKRDARRMG